VNLYNGVKQYQSEDSNQMDRKMRFKYETLSSLFKKTDAFNERGLALFNNLKEAVWVRLEENSTKDEILFMKRYD
jgi:hypothetical protein